MHLELLQELPFQCGDQALPVLDVAAGENGVIRSVKVREKETAIVDDDARDSR